MVQHRRMAALADRAQARTACKAPLLVVGIATAQGAASKLLRDSSVTHGMAAMTGNSGSLRLTASS